MSKAKTARRRRKSKAAPTEQVPEGSHRLGAFVNTFGPLPRALDGTALDPYIRDLEDAERALKRKGQRASALARRKISDAKFVQLAPTIRKDKDLARKLGVHPTTLSRYKKRRGLPRRSGSRAAK
jgi:hypothetical protein